MLCNQEFIKIFGTVALVMITSTDRRRFRLMGTALAHLQRNERKHVLLDPAHALQFLDGVEERARRLHAESLERDLTEIARVKAILRGEKPKVAEGA